MRLMVADRDTYSVDHHTHSTTELMSFAILTSLRHWIGCSPDAGQRDPPEPLAKIEEAQLSSEPNMRCGSHRWFP
jgi:hypothetical protein